MPAGHAAARDVARAEHEAGARARERDQARERRGVVGAVGVHLAHDLRALGERALEARDVGGAEAELGGPVDDLGAERLRERAGAVGRVVVDHDDVEVLAGERGPGALDHAGEAVRLLVGGEDEPDQSAVR